MTADTAQLQSPLDARERILAAAERLYAQRGDKASTRDITAEAGVNVASVNYYFRSKDALAEEIFMRLAKRVTDMRFAGLSACSGSARRRDKPQQLKALVTCFIAPFFEPEINGRLFARFMLQHRLFPSDMTRRVYEQYLDPFALEFIDALCRTDDRVDRLEWVWRFNMMASLATIAVTDTGPGNRIAVLSQGQADAGPGDELSRHLAEFLCRALSSR